MAPAESDNSPSLVLLRTPPDQRARAAASMFEIKGKVEGMDGWRDQWDDMFPAQAEALRSDIEDGWLKVFSQTLTENAGWRLLFGI